MCETNELFWQKIPEVAACGQAQRLLNFKELLPASIARMLLQNSDGFWDEPSAPEHAWGFLISLLLGTPALEMSVKLQRLVASVLGIMGWCGACHTCHSHNCWAVQSPWKGFPVLWNPQCARAKHLWVLAAGTWSFSGHCCLERGALMVMFSGPIF